MKKIQMTKTIKWCVNHKAVPFVKDQELSIPEDVPADVASRMVETGHAVILVDDASKVAVEETKPEPQEKDEKEPKKEETKPEPARRGGRRKDK